MKSPIEVYFPFLAEAREITSAPYEEERAVALVYSGVMGSRTEERLALLRGSMDELCTLLEASGEHHWLNWARTCRQGLDEPTIQAFQAIIGGYGGMGSFSDLVIHPRNGHDGEIDSANAALKRLRSRIYTDARFLCSPERASYSHRTAGEQSR